MPAWWELQDPDHHWVGVGRQHSLFLHPAGTMVRGIPGCPDTLDFLHSSPPSCLFAPQQELGVVRGAGGQSTQLWGWWWIWRFAESLQWTVVRSHKWFTADPVIDWLPVPAGLLSHCCHLGSKRRVKFSHWSHWSIAVPLWDFPHPFLFLGQSQLVLCAIAESLVVGWRATCQETSSAQRR